VYFVPLQAVSGCGFIVPAIAGAINFQFYGDGNAQGQLLNFLRGKTLLIVLDNFEHLLDGADLISDILTAAPTVKVIVTSREALNLQEEWLRPVGGMRFPESDGVEDEELETYSAVRFFEQNASRIRAGFSLAEEQSSVIRICRLVGGLPLALELAATWLKTLTCGDIAREIQYNLDFLAASTRNIPERHRSMRAVFDHSWELLTAEERAVFKKLSIFRGGFEQAAAEQVAGASLWMLAALVDKSLLQRHANGRYDFHELLRQFAEEMLDAVPEEHIATHNRHCAYYADLLNAQWQDLQGSKPKEALATIENEIKNVRRAWQWAVEHKRAAEIEKAADSLWFFYDTRSWYLEGEEAFALAVKALDTPAQAAGTPEKSLVYAKVLAEQGVLCNSLYLSDKAKALLEESLDIFRRFNARYEIGFALTRLGEVAAFTWNAHEAIRLHKEALAIFRELGNRWNTAYVLTWLANTHMGLDDFDQGEQYCNEALAIFREIGNRWGIAISLASLSFAMINLDAYDEAERMCAECVALARDIGIQWGVAEGLYGLGTIARIRGRYAEAKCYLAEALEMAFNFKIAQYIVWSLFEIVELLKATGEEALYLEFGALLLLCLDRYGRKQLRAELQAQVPPEIFAAAVQRAQEPGFESAARDRLAEWRECPEPNEPAPGPAHPQHADLTGRELEILRLVGEGRSNREVAAALFLSLGTVKWYLNQIYGKLHVVNRSQAITHAREMNLI
jgi:predicted ATPase/DNA-binding CsgD family transcriptional regulator